MNQNNQPAEKIHNHIRGLSPYPAAFTKLQGKNLKVFKATLELGETKETAGTFVTDGKTFLKFAAADGYLSLEDIQYEGKKRMQVGEFLRGMRL